MLAEIVVGSEGVHPVDGVPLRLVFVQGLQHVLNPPQLPLDVDVLLAGRLRLVGGSTESIKGLNRTQSGRQWSESNVEESELNG